MAVHRGRPRSPRVDEAVSAALLALLEETSYPTLSIESVAARAEVGKPAIYRRWPSKAAMVFDLILDRPFESPRPHGRTLRANIDSLADLVVRSLSTPGARNAIPGLIADLANDEAVAKRFHEEFIEPQRRVVAEILSEAHARGELATLPDAADVHAQLLGAAFTPLFLLAEPPPADLATGMADRVMHSLTHERPTSAHAD